MCGLSLLSHCKENMSWGTGQTDSVSRVTPLWCRTCWIYWYGSISEESLRMVSIMAASGMNLIILSLEREKVHSVMVLRLKPTWRFSKVFLTARGGCLERLTTMWRIILTILILFSEDSILSVLIGGSITFQCQFDNIWLWTRIKWHQWWWKVDIRK